MINISTTLKESAARFNAMQSIIAEVERFLAGERNFLREEARKLLSDWPVTPCGSTDHDYALPGGNYYLYPREWAERVERMEARTRFPVFYFKNGLPSCADAEGYYFIDDDENDGLLNILLLLLRDGKIPVQG